MSGHLPAGSYPGFGKRVKTEDLRNFGGQKSVTQLTKIITPNPKYWHRMTKFVSLHPFMCLLSYMSETYRIFPWTQQIQKT